MNRDLPLLIGRILLVAIFPIAAYYKIVGWPAFAGTLAKGGLSYSPYLGGLAIAAEIGLPLLMILGLFTRWAAAGLIIYTAVATYIGHPVWRLPHDAAFFGQLMNFWKNVAMIGGFVLILAFGSGRYAMRPP